MQTYLEAFDENQLLDASKRVNALVRSLQGRKVEEDDWTKLYCDVKNAPYPGWSNLPFRDYIHEGIGVEFKLLKKKNPSSYMTKWLMHPAATRKIDFDPSEAPEVAMAKVFAGWNSLIDEFEARVKATSKDGRADLRWGILLWAEDHSEFLYFEERLEKPQPEDFAAKWHEGKHRGKETRNLHIFERANPKIKRFSVTMPGNGSKLQPYFRIPTIEEGAHLFQAEQHNSVPLFVEKGDLDRLLRFFPDESPEASFGMLLDAEEARR